MGTGSGTPGGTRTPDILLVREALYQLSYGRACANSLAAGACAAEAELAYCGCDTGRAAALGCSAAGIGTHS